MKLEILYSIFSGMSYTAAPVKPRAVYDDLKPLNLGLATAWRRGN